MPIEPSQEQLTEIGVIAGGEADGPVVMLNLNRYRDRAAYLGDPPCGRSPDVSGHEAYGRYGEVAQAVLGRVGARILWYAQSESTVIGDESDRYDEVIAVWYPSRSAFLALATAPEIIPALAHRAAGLERAALISCESGPEAALAGA
jgi:uncharacterized protein (DUF1330 family)